MISNADSVNTPVHRLISFPTVFGIPNKPTDFFERRDFTSGKNCTLIEKDHLGDWSPEKDYCLWLTFRQPVRKPSSESLSDSLTFRFLLYHSKMLRFSQDVQNNFNSIRFIKPFLQKFKIVGRFTKRSMQSGNFWKKIRSRVIHLGTIFAFFSCQDKYFLSSKRWIYCGRFAASKRSKTAIS